MSNPFTDSRKALWTQIDNDASLTAFFEAGGGTKYKLDEGGIVPKKVTQVVCPCMTILPTDIDIEWDGSTFKEFFYACDVLGYIYATVPDEIEEFAWMTMTAIWAGFRTRMGLNFLKAYDIPSVSFKGFQEGNLFFLQFTFPVRFRINRQII